MSNEEQKSKLAQEIIQLARNSLVVNLRFMDNAVSLMKTEPYEGAIATDGAKLYYDPVYILRAYKTAQEYPTRCYLHSLLHCVFRHWYVNTLVNHQCWDLACDIAVESIINELNIDSTRVPGRANSQQAAIASFKESAKSLTAEKIYHYLLEAQLSDDEISKLRMLFAADDHNMWYSDETDGGGGGKGNGEGDGEGKGSVIMSTSQDEDFSDSQLAATRAQLSKEWQEISEKMLTDLETFSKQMGNSAGTMVMGLREVNRERYDYSEFLKKFSVLGETMTVNNDEFDYIFYTYGLELYERMPLIEPLEYKDVKRIKEFVIAIDTSGSVLCDALVQRFVQKTYNILMQQENFFTKVNIHIIQCDTAIQEDKKITCTEEFEDYIKNMELHGFGGTDFRPVFSYVDSLIDVGEFTDLRGLIYFTDGFGAFPSKQPAYNSAFVFVQDEYNNYDVPVWAIKLILQKEEL